MKTTDKPVVVEQIINTSVEEAWRAITDLSEMKKWYFANINSFKPEVGSKSKFAVHVEDRTFTHLWEVTEIVPFKKITYNWKYEEYTGDSYVTFELFQEKEAVKIKLSVQIVEDFPEAVPEFSRDSCVAGWNYFIGQNLKTHLEGG